MNMQRMSDWLDSLNKTKKVALGLVLGFALLIGIGSQSQPQTANLTTDSTSHKSQSQKTSAPTVTTKTETETQPIPFTSTTVNDANLAKGTTKVTTAGVNGSQTVTYKVTYINGKQTDKKTVSTVITLQPVTQVTSVGTYVAPPPPPPPTKPATSSNCDPNYSGACVPNVYPSDVDCAGGSGNGPYYVQGPVRIIGVDRYGLDRDGNGIGCG